jgi:hypothetical protein
LVGGAHEGKAEEENGEKARTPDSFRLEYSTSGVKL